MHWWTWLLIVLGVLLAGSVGLILDAQRHRAALIELVRLVRPCIALFRDIMRDPTLPRRTRVIPALVVAYLALPIDLVPDFLPVIGHLDDALIVAFALRHLVAATGRDRVAQHWTGEPKGLERVLKLARVN